MSKCKDIDALLIDRLYGELDDAALARFDKHVADCGGCQSELDALSATRDVFRELPELEPPSALSAILLHEAAKQVPARVVAAAAPSTGEPGLVARIVGFLSPVFHHPAMAAAAMLVLVVGVAGTMYLRGDSKVAQPEYSGAATEATEATEATDGVVATGTVAAADSLAALTASPPAAATAPMKLRGSDSEPTDKATSLDESDDDESTLAQPARGENKIGGDGKMRQTLADQKGKANKLGNVYAADVVGKDQGRRLNLSRNQAQRARGGENEMDLSGSDEAKKEITTPRRMRSQLTPRQTASTSNTRDTNNAKGAKNTKRKSATYRRKSRRPAVANAVTGADPAPITDVAQDLRLPAGKRSIRVGTGSQSRGATASSRSSANAPGRPAGGLSAGGSRAAPQAAPPPRAQPRSPKPAVTLGKQIRNQKRAKAELAWVKSRGRELARAAKRTQCRTVARIANDIRSRNRVYWSANVRYDRSLKACAKLIASDWLRRVRVRGKRRFAAPNRTKRATSKSSAASKPAAAKAAPREQAADSASD